MRISDFSVKNYQLTVVLFAMMVALGVNSWFAIPRAEDPSFPVPIYSVVAIYPGASPNDVEQLVVDPLEEKIGELDDLKDLTADVRDGLAVVRAEFEPSVDADRKYDEVVREVNALRASLPSDLRSVEVRKTTSADVNIVQIALVSEVAPFHTLDHLAKRLEDRIEAVPGVRGAERWGAPDREIRVSLDLGRLGQLGIPATRVLAAIGSDNANIPAGSVDVGARRFNVKSSGDYETPEEVRASVIGGSDGQVVRVSDVATVEWGYADPTHITRYNGKRAVFVTATQREDRNIVEVRDRIYATLDRFERSLPPTVKLERGFDQAQNVSKRLGRLGEDFAIAILLVLVTLLPLGLRAASIVMISIPLSLAIGVTLLRFTGFTVNQLSIVGFVIALGLLVDDSIVVVENIARFLREGRSRREAAILATKQIAVAVVGCTATLVLAFLPLLFLPGLPGRYIRSMPVTVVYTVLASLLVSLTIIPWLASLIMKEENDEHGGRVFRLLDRGIHASYAPLLHRALARPVPTLLIAVALFVASLGLIPMVGFSLFPKAGTPQFAVRIETPDGASLDETDRAARFAERVIGARPEVRSVFTNVGRDNPQIYYNVVPRSENASAGQLFVLLHEYDPKHTPAVFDTLRASLAAYPGARIELREFENGPPIDAPIAIRVMGPDLDTLRALARQVERTLASTEGTQYVNNPLRIDRTDLVVDVDREKAGLLGVPTVDVDRTLRLGIAGVSAGRFRDASGDERDITVRLPHGRRPAADALDRVYLTSQAGEQVPLRQIAAVRFEATPPLIQHHDEERAVTVTSSVGSGFNTDRVTRQVLAALDSIPVPDGYAFVAAGEIESRQDSFGGIGTAIIVATFMILAILVLEFRTFKSTLIVASVIPLGLVGGLVALFVTGNTLSFTAMIGFVALVGIEIKTSILLVDFTNQLREAGMSLDDAIQRAGEVRFVPIVLTTLTAIGGLLPLALQGSSLYSPLAWVIIGGLVSSTVLSRLVTPVMYKLLAPAIVR